MDLNELITQGDAHAAMLRFEGDDTTADRYRYPLAAAIQYLKWRNAKGKSQKGAALRQEAKVKSGAAEAAAEHGRLRQPHYIASGDGKATLAEEMRELQDWLLAEGKSRNTVANYLRIIRTIYRHLSGEDDDILELCDVNNQPTRGVNGKGLDLIPELEGLQLERRSELDWGRDLFLMSYYADGMPIATLATLRRVAPGVYVYGDDGKKALVASAQLEQLLKKYEEEGARYALPILERAGRGTATSKVEYAAKIAARALAAIGTRIDVPWLSMKNARSLALLSKKTPEAM